MNEEELRIEAEENYHNHKIMDFQGFYNHHYYYLGYVESAEPREKRIADLEEKLANADYQLEGRDLEIKELEAQIEKMKNCKNCENYMISGKCPSFFRTGWCKNWEMTRSKK